MEWATEKQELAGDIIRLLYEHRMIRTFYRDNPAGWRLMSGLYSPVYVQLRPLASFPVILDKVCRSMVRLIREEAPDAKRVVGIAMAGIPPAVGMSLLGNIPAAFTRKLENVKTLESLRVAMTAYGEHSLIEGELHSDERIVLIDDLVTRFDSKLIAIEMIRHAIALRKLERVDYRTVAVILDREQGGAQAAEREGVRLLSLIPFKSVGLPLLESVMHPYEIKILKEYLDDPAKFQDDEAQEELRRAAEKTA
jgi:orotate phosphoribosyltransferase